MWLLPKLHAGKAPLSTVSVALYTACQAVENTLGMLSGVKPFVFLFLQGAMAACQFFKVILHCLLAKSSLPFAVPAQPGYSALTCNTTDSKRRPLIAAPVGVQAAEKELPGLADDLAAGKFDRLRVWLNEKIHSVGSLYTSGDELLKAVTGAPLDPSIFLDYLREKYSALYKL